MPAVTIRQIEVFLDQVATGSWQGDQSVWLASDDPTADTQWLPVAGDWMRAVQPAAAAAAKPPAKAARRAPVRKKAQ